jgi:hypothetical protein
LFRELFHLYVTELARSSAMTKAETIKIWSIGPNGAAIPMIAEAPSPFANQAAKSG